MTDRADHLMVNIVTGNYSDGRIVAPSAEEWRRVVQAAQKTEQAQGNDYIATRLKCLEALAMSHETALGVLYDRIREEDAKLRWAQTGRSAHGSAMESGAEHRADHVHLDRSTRGARS